MEVIKWADGQGQKLILTRDEAEDLRDAVEAALRYGRYDDGVYFEAEIE